MKKILFLLAFFLLVVFFSLFSVCHVRAENISESIELHVFYGQGCPHCASLLSYLPELKKEYPTLEISEHEVYHNSEERELFERVAKKFQIEIGGVPTVFIGERVLVGFGLDVADQLKTEIKKCSEQKCPDPITDLAEESGMKKLTIPIVIGAAAVDAINPCAFAVLIILMAAALSIVDKKRALKFGLAFTLSIYIAYFSMGLGLFSALQTTKLSHGFYFFVVGLAVIIGLFNVKDYFWYGKGFLMEVPLSWRPRMKKLLASATSPTGAFLVGFAVSLFELPCTGGPYIVILGLLAKEMTRWSGIGYLLLYNLVFVLPLVVLSVIIYKGISTTEKLEQLRQEKLRILHLIAGIIMLAIAGLMILSITQGWV